MNRLFAKSAEKMIRHRLEQMLDLITVVSKKDSSSEDCIHQLRAETRRSDAALRLLVNWLPHRKTEYVRRQLWRIRRISSRVRDLDVIMPELGMFEGQIPDEAAQWLKTQLTKRRRKNGHHIQRYCRQLLDAGVKENFRSIGSRIRWRCTEKPDSFEEFYLSSLQRQVNKFGVVIESLSTDDHQLHKVRIVARRMRYTLELLTKIITNFPVETDCTQLAELQDAIGGVNDQLSTVEFLHLIIKKCEQQRFVASIEKLSSSFESSVARKVESMIPPTLERAREIHDQLLERTSRSSSLSGHH